jgi:hypothetical protein
MPLNNTQKSLVKSGRILKIMTPKSEQMERERGGIIVTTDEIQKVRHDKGKKKAN